MAKGEWSAEAIIGRAKVRAAERAKEFEAVKEKVAKPEVGVSGGSGSSASISAEQLAMRWRSYGQPTTTGTTTPFTPSPDGSTWNYKGAKTDMQGRPIQTRSFLGFQITPQGFDPHGDPYFGAGGSAWLQKWAYKFAEEVATREVAQDAWKKYAETSVQFSESVTGISAQEYQALSQDKKRQRDMEQAGLFVKGVAELFDASGKSIEAIEGGLAKYGRASPLTYGLRAVNAAIGMTLEAFTVASEIPERAQGAVRAAREYADVNGSVLPSISFVDDGEVTDTTLKFWDVKEGQTFGFSHELGNFMSRILVPGLQVYDEIRFLTAPGSAKEKIQAVQNGWNEGRMLYTELFKESVRNEYISRAKEGEDPFLLAMELEDPWIEMGGEMIFDPMNALGAWGKAKKAASYVDEATRVVTMNGLLNKADFVDEVAGLSKIANDVEGTAKLDLTANHILQESTEQARRIGEFQGYKLYSLTPEANKISHRKVFGNYFATVTQAVRNSGGSADDVADFLNAVRKFSSGDKKQVIEGLATISHMPLKTMAFNDAAFEVGYFMNKIMGEGDFIKEMQKLGGNFTELNKFLDAKIDKAMDYAFPSVKELSRASEKAAELAKAGEEVDEATKRLSDAFDILKKEHPGYIGWSKIHDLVDQTLKPINGFLSNNYFSLSYGYAFRNLMQNLVTLWVDDGITFAEGMMKYDPTNGFVTPGLDDFILKQNGGMMPEVFKMSNTFIGKTTEGSLGSRFFNWLNAKGWSPAKMSAAFEIYSGKMIYVKKYKKTMDSIAVLGGMFPEMSKWVDAGYTQEQANDFVRLFKSSDYDINKTAQTFARKYGDGTVDKWRLLDWIQPEAEKGLGDYGDYWDNFLKAVNDPDNTYTDVLNKLDELDIKVRKEANKAALTPAQLNDHDGLAKVMMDDGAHAGKFKNVAADNELINLRIQANKTFAEYSDALKELYRKAPEARSREIFDAISDVSRTERNNGVITRTQELLDGTIALRDKARKAENLAALWDVNLMGKVPSGIITQDIFYKAMWDGYYFQRADTWNKYFNNELDMLTKFAQESPEMGQMFNKANLDNLKLQQYRNYLYNDKGIYAQPPKINPAPVGTAQNLTNVRTLGYTYGIGTEDEKLLNTINKYASKHMSGLERTLEKGKAIRRANLAGEKILTGDALASRTATMQLIEEAGKKMDEAKKEFGAAQRAARAAAQPGEAIPKIRWGYEKLSQVFMSIPNEATAFDIPALQRIAERFDKKIPAEILAHVEELGGEISRRDMLELVANFEAGRPIESIGRVGFAKLDDVPPDLAEKIFAERAGHPNMKFVKKLDDANYGASGVVEGLPVAPARDDFVSPGAHAFAENRDGMLGAIKHIRDGIRERAGLRVKTGTATMNLNELMPDITERMSIANYKSKIVAEKYRDFALLPYGEKTNFDLAMGMVYPYQFWYSRTYKNWMQRAFASNPEIISRYANLKEAMASEHKDLPDWWKSQLNVSSLFGVETDNPIYINLEAALFPLYGLTGTDFNDPQKRINGWTATLDDMGKFGPSVFAPIQLATAAILAAQGEKDVAAKWGSRLIPQTATVKAVSSFFGTPIELDPAVQYFSGDGFLDFQASDPYEESRIARALAAMQSEGVSEEALIEAARTHKGTLWEEAYQRAVQQRAPGQITSFFLGTGFKARTAQDVQTDRFYADYYRMKNLRDGGFMTSDQYREAFDKMREVYPFMDVLLLSRRSGDGREAAYAYNVMSRVPPGMSKEFYQVIGVDQETAQKFYDSGGKLETMSETEQDRFMAAMVDLGAMLKIPSNTTRQEWTQARIAYGDMNEALTRAYGEDINDKISRYYGFDDTKDARAYLLKHPEVEAALDARTAMTVGTPNLMKFYGGIDTLDRYYTGKMYDTLEKEFGSDIFAVEDAYYEILDKAERRQYRREHPELKEYWDRKSELKEENLRAVVTFGSRLPDAPQLQTTGKTPENPTEKRLQDFIDQPPAPTFQEWQQELGAPMTDLIQEYWFNDQELPSTVTNSLDYVAEQYGYQSGDDMLQAILMSMQ